MCGSAIANALDVLDMTIGTGISSTCWTASVTVPVKMLLHVTLAEQPMVGTTCCCTYLSALHITDATLCTF